MPLFYGDIENKEKLEKWRVNLGININPNIKIKNTKDRGIGVFYKIDDEDIDDNERIELIRIPHLSTYNIYTLKTLVNEKLNKDDQKVIKRCLSIIFSQINGNSESLILIAYFIGFLLVCNKNKPNEENNDWKNDIQIYLNVLLKTTVGNLYNNQQDLLEDFSSYFPGNIIIQNSISDITSGFWYAITDKINEEFKEKYNEIKFEEVLQICSAIRSRVLEIPREVDEEDNVEENDGDRDDYYVDVTLVPILDYVNHDNYLKNAYFDVDRKSQDIILYYDSNKQIKENEEIEIFISYDMFEDLHRMFINYGFLPNSENVIKVIEIPILGYNQLSLKINDFEITKRLYCIRQSPNVQFKILFDNFGEIKNISVLNESFYSFLVFKDDIDWESFEKEDENEEFEGIDFEKGFDRSLDILEKMSKEEVEATEKKFYEYVVEFFREFEKKVKIFTDIINEYEINGDENKNIFKLVDFYGKMAKFMLSRMTFDNFFNGKDDDNENIFGYLETRMMPIYNFEATISGIEIGEMKINK